jgi:hypothetical protein
MFMLMSTSGVDLATCGPPSTQCSVATIVQISVQRCTGHFLVITALCYSEWRLQQYKSYLSSCTCNTIPSYIVHGSFKMFSESILFLGNIKPYNHISYISFKIVPLCKYTLLSAAVKVLDTFLETTLWKPFQLFRRILNVSNIAKAPSLQGWFHSREQVKFSWSQVDRVWGMLQCCNIVLC